MIYRKGDKVRSIMPNCYIGYGNEGVVEKVNEKVVICSCGTFFVETGVNVNGVEYGVLQKHRMVNIEEIPNEVREAYEVLSTLTHMQTSIIYRYKNNGDLGAIIWKLAAGFLDKCHLSLSIIEKEIRKPN